MDRPNPASVRPAPEIQVAFCPLALLKAVFFYTWEGEAKRMLSYLPGRKIVNTRRKIKGTVWETVAAFT
jgi:hypothetical protein